MNTLRLQQIRRACNERVSPNNEHVVAYEESAEV